MTNRSNVAWQAVSTAYSSAWPPLPAADLGAVVNGGSANAVAASAAKIPTVTSTATALWIGWRCRGRLMTVWSKRSDGAGQRASISLILRTMSFWPAILSRTV